MTERKFSFNLKNRRGLSSVVGALLFVVLMVATFSVLGIALDSQTAVVNTNREVAETGLKKQQENFVISNAIQTPGETLEIYVSNKGQNPSEIFTLVITNSSDISNGFPTKTIEIPSDTSFVPANPEKSTDIVKTLNLKMKTPPAFETDIYQFKVVSSLGKIEKFNLICDDTGLCGISIGGGGTGSLAAQLFLDGPNGVNTKTSTVIMFVSNTGDVPLQNVMPIDTCEDMLISITPPGGLEDFTGCAVDPSTPQDLAPGQMVLFKWDGVVSGDINDVFLFCNGASGEELDATPVPDSNIDCDTLTVIDPNDCGGCGPGGEGEGNEPIIILDDLLIRPSLFLTLPSPFGSAGDLDDLGLWGVNIANPTNSTMDVSKVTITAFAPGSQEQMLVFSQENGAQHQTVIPAGVGLGDWCVGKDCGENVATWKNFDSPIELPPYSNESFFFKAKPQGTTNEYEAIIVQSSVFTTSGSFGKPGYQTTMFGSGGVTNDSPIANVYLTTALNSRDNGDIRGHMSGITNGTAQNFLVTLADMDNNDETAIKKGAKLIVNVPREWTNVDVFSNSTNIEIIDNPNPELGEPSIKEHGDGSVQIIATTDTHLGNGTNPNTATLSFTATSPNKINERMYIMYVLGYGQTEANFSVGPLSEVVLHVIGNVTGYPAP